MTVADATTLLLACLPVLLSLAGEGWTARVICLIAGALTLLLSAELNLAGLAWIAGMAIALDSIWERVCPTLAGVFPAKQKARQNVSRRAPLLVSLDQG